MEITCDWCGTVFERKPGQIKARNYCSRACLGKANEERFRQKRLKVCDYCGRTFEYSGHHADRNNHFFCSMECASAFKVKQEEVVCDLCGKRFMKKRSDIARSQHNFCSEECYRNYVELMKENKKGLIYNGKPVYRIMVEQKLGRELTQDEEVHHIDGDHFNNDISNLIVLSKTEHSKIHASWKDRNEAGKFVEGGDAE